MSGDKVRIRRGFAAAADSYDRAAIVQREAGERLLAGLQRDRVTERIIDLGCGTGHGLEMLGARWPTAQLIALDFARPMLLRLPEARRHLAVCADAEASPLANASADLVWSNLTVQWCAPRRFAAEAARLLRHGGRLAVSSLGPNTFAELRRTFAGVDGYRHTIDFVAPAALAGAFGTAGISVTTVERITVVRHHENLRGLLDEVRDIGANRVAGGARRTGLMGKAAWQEFAAAYEALRTDDGLPLSYDLVLLHGEK